MMDAQDEYDPEAAIKALEAKASRTRMHLSVCMTNALEAASQVHVAACRINEESPVQSYLSDALHSLLIVAEECRQALRPQDARP
ncbi:hypothetical protein [Roseomonas chloroacetimidivorans]|uniref:hypothetical protein n=1 Tax=Roseomonas chloroacetimidivorans TaxID=1766656 RepID=UPI003C781421